MVAHCLARTSGSRKGRTTTFMPNLSRWVRPASAAMTDIDSSIGWLEMRRSVCQTESTRLSSQRSIQRQRSRDESKGRLARPRPIRTLTGAPLVEMHDISAVGGEQGAVRGVRRSLIGHTAR